MTFNLAGYLAQNAAGVGVLGAVVGGSAAAAKTYKDRKRGLIDTRQAVVYTSREATGAGIATAVSAVAAGVVGGGLLSALTAAFVAASVTKYGWDRVADKVQAPLARGSELS